MNSNYGLKIRYAFLAIALLAILSLSFQKASGDVNDIMHLDSNNSCITPLVVLQNGANQTSTIYANNTSAKISIDATNTSLSYNYSLNIVNDNASSFEARLEYYYYENITRVNTTIILHNNSTSSNQIIISGGSINQINDYYNLVSNATIYIGVMNLVENTSAGKTILNVYLRIKNPSTTTYTLYIVTFEFT